MLDCYTIVAVAIFMQDRGLTWETANILPWLLCILASLAKRLSILGLGMKTFQKSR